jgi:hypothetical protein
VLLVIGWGGPANCGESLLELTAVLCLWEDRLGARLIDVGYVDLRLFAERPPRTLEAGGSLVQACSQGDVVRQCLTRASSEAA